MVTATVRPAPGRAPVEPPREPEPPKPAGAPAPAFSGQGLAAKAPSAKGPGATPFAPAAHLRAPSRPAESPSGIEPGRKRRLTRERDPIDLRLDLHGLDQDRARIVLTQFLVRAQDEGVRAVLVITGKGSRGDGVLRRRAPEWLSDPRLRAVVAGVSEAHRRHGGEGALYVALKRKGS
jgi:DNA-nicking Smr family endonuclease